MQYPQGLYQAPEASIGTATSTMSSCHNVPDDMLLMAQSRDELEGQLGQITSRLEGLGFVVNREKSHLCPTQSIKFLAFLVNSQEMSIKLTEEKVAQIATACRRVREAGSLSVLQLTGLIRKMTATIPAVHPGIPRVGMVVDQNEPVEWEADPTTGTRLSYRDRCLNAWLGSNLQWCKNWWSLVTDREQQSHQLPGTPCSHLCHEGICQGHKECSHPIEDGQQHCCILRESDRRDPLHSTEQPGNPTVAVVSSEECVTIRTPTGSRQLHSRRGIQDNSIHSGMAATLSCLPADNGYVQCGSVYNTSQYSAGKVCEQETRSRVRCTATDLDRLDGICFSPILSNREMSKEGEGGRDITNTDSTSMEIPAMVPCTARATDRLSPGSTNRPSTPDGPIWQTPSPDDSRATSASRLEAFRSRQLAEGNLLNCWQLDGVKGLTTSTRVHGSNGMAGVLNGKWIPFHVL